MVEPGYLKAALQLPNRWLFQSQGLKTDLAAQ
jgi:hypothetical protein